MERYTVRSIVYRRHLVDSPDLEGSPEDEAAPRWPVAWLFLRPAKFGPRHQLPHEVGTCLPADSAGSVSLAAGWLFVGCGTRVCKGSMRSELLSWTKPLLCS